MCTSNVLCSDEVISGGGDMMTNGDVVSGREGEGGGEGGAEGRGEEEDDREEGRRDEVFNEAATTATATTVTMVPSRQHSIMRASGQ